VRGETGDALWNIRVCSYDWGARTFGGVRCRAPVQSQKPSRRTDAHRFSSTRARLSGATIEQNSSERGRPADRKKTSSMGIRVVFLDIDGPRAAAAPLSLPRVPC